MTTPRRLFDRSLSLLGRARQVVPGASQTLSKAPSAFVEGAYPVFLERGRGCRVWDVDGNEYVDYVLGLGAVTLGYDYPAVSEAVARQLRSGSILSLPHPLEVEVSERLVQIIPCAQMVRFLKTGSEANAAAVRVARAATGRDVIAVCYPPDTEILTEQEGFRPITALRVGERVATLNRQTGELEYQPVLHLTTRPFNGNLVHFSGTRVDLLVTPDHRILRGFRDSARRETFRLVEARSVLGRRAPLRMLAGARWVGEPQMIIEIPSARVVPNSGRRDRFRGHPTKGITQFPAKPFLRFLGYFVTEGWALKARRPRYEIQLSQSPGPVRDRILAVIREMGFRPSVRGQKISFASKELWSYLQECGSNAQTKRLPTPIKRLSPDLLEELFQAMIDGDGTRTPDGSPRKFYSTSRALSDDMCELALKLGYSTTVTAVRGAGFSQMPVYHVSLSRETIREITPDKIREVPYDGLVYCLTVPNHIVFVRRNGKAIWSGNCGYHGWLDWYAITTPRTKGIPKTAADLVIPFTFNDLSSLETALDEHRGRVAAVIMEPVLLEEPAPGFLAGVRDAVHRHGALLIFDEIVCGFRWAVGGAQQYFGVVPDLATFGKGMANGLPLAAVVGRAELMREFEEVFVSSTFGGDTVALAACLATIEEYTRQPVIEHLWRIGGRFQSGFRALAASLNVPADCIGYPVHPKIGIRHGLEDTARLLMSLFLQETAKRGVIFHFAGFNMSFSHAGRDVDETLEACAGALRVVADALSDGRISERLEGRPYQEPFRRS